MGKELLKLLAALGVGIATIVGANLANYVPEGTNAVTNGLLVAVVALVKRGVDYLVSLKTPAPVPPA